MRKFLSAILVLLILAVTPLLVFAQDEGVTNIDELIKDLLGAGGWPLALAAVFSLGMALLTGRLGFKGKLIKIPFLSEWLNNKIPPKWLPLIIVTVAGLIGLFTSLSEAMSMASAVSGLISGILSGVAATGLHQVYRKTGKALTGKD